LKIELTTTSSLHHVTTHEAMTRSVRSLATSILPQGSRVTQRVELLPSSNSKLVRAVLYAADGATYARTLSRDAVVNAAREVERFGEDLGIVFLENRPLASGFHDWSLGPPDTLRRYGASVPIRDLMRALGGTI
jgi:hypothetical protein